MNYLIDIKDMLEKKSRVLIFISQNKIDRTTKIDEAGKWEGKELESLWEGSGLSILKEDSLKKIKIKNNNYEYTRNIRKYLQAG